MKHNKELISQTFADYLIERGYDAECFYDEVSGSGIRIDHDQILEKDLHESKYGKLFRNYHSRLNRKK